MATISAYIHLECDFQAKAREEVIDGKPVTALSLGHDACLFFPSGGNRLVFVPAGHKVTMEEEKND